MERNAITVQIVPPQGRRGSSVVDFTGYKQVVFFDCVLLEDILTVIKDQFPHLALTDLTLSSGHDGEIYLEKQCCPHRISDPQDVPCADAILPKKTS